MNCLKAGFCRLDVTPMLGIDIRGYFQNRTADGVRDPLEANFLALGCGEDKTILVSVDNCGFDAPEAEALIRSICESTGLPEENVCIHGTHTHTGPTLRDRDTDPLQAEYFQTLTRKLCDGTVMALADMKPAKMGYGIGQARNVSFMRRYRMKDGSVRTNPGVNNPDILEPIGKVDENVNVLRFDREGDSLVLVNFGNHPDVVGGCKLSADWPGFTRKFVEQAIPGTKCIFFNGAQGDVNHVNVHPVGGDLNDMFMDFDDVSRGYGHARHHGRVVAGAVMQVYDKVKYIDVSSIRCAKCTVRVPSNMPDPAELPEAHRINDLHREGRDAELPYTGMMLTTVLAKASRSVALEHGPEYFELPLTAIAIGDLAIIGISGEPFTAIGTGLKAAEGWDLVLPFCLVNGDAGYFPTMDAYVEGGYESASSHYKAGVSEILIEEGQKLLASLR